MKTRVFVDTNILVYAYDVDAGPKHERARAVIADLWETESGILSTQVLLEFYRTVTGKLRQPIPPAEARKYLATLAVWEVIGADSDLVLEAARISDQQQCSIWEAMLLAAARRAGADLLYSEDLSHGRRILGIRIVNPLLES